MIWASLFQSTWPIGVRPDADIHGAANFAITEFSEVDQEFIGNSSLLASVVAL
jgi:hypothetical protein